MEKKEQLLKSLEYFKDWSNYLLVTTVAAVGWVGANGGPSLNANFIVPIIWCFALSVVLGIFTLALIPLVAEKITDDTESIYYVKGTFRLLWMLPPELSFALKYVCWPQHVLFIAGIILYAAGISADRCSGG